MASARDDAQTASLKVDLLKAIDNYQLGREDLTNKSKDLETAIRKWVSSSEKTPRQTGYGLYLLQNSSKTDISLSGLQSADLGRFRDLQVLESRCHFNVFIAQVEKREIASRNSYAHAFEESEESEDEDNASTTTNSRTHEVEWSIQVLLNSPKPHQLEIDPNSILQGDAFKDDEPDEIGGLPDGYDESVDPNTYWYCRYYRSLVSVDEE
ncbi:hypothetical protein M426DRAFT_239828 [Hypoxylon sp. CI-4A]|nr:hypothetical protein M426DRAFT_239828 [Hypoxylon sp. CI-4A]